MILSKKIEQFNFFYIGLIILWPVIKSVFFNIDGANRLETIFSAIAVLVNAKFILKCPKAFFFWMAWVAFNLINTHFKGFYVEGYPYSVWAPYRLFVPMIVMFITYHTALSCRRDLYRYLAYCFLLYIILGVMGFASSESYDSIRYSNDLGNFYLNTLILSATYAAICYFKKNIPTSIVYVLLILSFGVIALSGERKGFLALLVIIFGFFYAKNLGKGFKTTIGLVLLAIVSYVGVGFLMEYTTAGQRMAFSMEYNTQYADNLFLKLMGDRAFMYAEGWICFLNNIWTGIGLMNAYLIVGGTMFHTEYMVQLTECGLIGSSLFLAFYISMIMRCIKLMKDSTVKKMGYILSFTLLAIILINFVAWSYDNTFYFMFFGILFAESDKIIRNNYSTNKRFLRI